jgi:PIN domain nuclease of toxin-antitoxin system
VIVLDTHAFVWWAAGSSKLSAVARLGRGAPADPADQLIVATAMVHGAPLVTRDERIRGFGGVTTLW